MNNPLPPSGRQVELIVGDARAVIVEVGGGVRTLTLNGRRVIAGYDEDQMAGGGRGQHLLPWPNRVRDGRWTWRGHELQLPLTEPSKSNAIHGLVRWGTWEIVETTPALAVLRHVVQPQPGWPARLEVTCAWRLTAAALTAEVTVRSQAPDAVPFGYGAHPYLAPGGTLVDDEVLSVPAGLLVETDPRGLPVGQRDVAGTAYDFRTARKVETTVLDTCFGELDRDVDGNAAVRLGGIQVWGDSAFRWFQIFSGDTLPVHDRRRSLAIEPMTCPPDALRSGVDLIVLEPEMSWSATWGLRLV